MTTADSMPVSVGGALLRGGRGDGRSGIIGLSGSPASWNALAYGCGWAQRTNSSLTIVHVLRSCPPYAVDGYATAVMSDLADEMARDLVLQTSRWMQRQPVSWSFQTANGNPAVTLAKLAQAQQADAIILGRPQPKLFRRPVPLRLSRHTTRIIIAVP